MAIRRKAATLGRLGAAVAAGAVLFAMGAPSHALTASDASRVDTGHTSRAEAVRAITARATTARATTFTPSGSSIGGSTARIQGGGAASVAQGNTQSRIQNSRVQSTVQAMTAGMRLTANTALNSSNGQVRLVMQADGKLVKTVAGSQVWSYSCPAGSQFVMGADGRVSVVTAAGRTCWSRPTIGTGAKLTLNNDGRLLRTSSGGTEVITPFGHAVQLPNAAAAKQMAGYINSERTRRGLRPLTVSIRMNAAAHNHNEWMAPVGLTHQAPGERPFDQRVRDAGYVWKTVGENVGYYGITNAATAMPTLHTEFMKSKGHRDNILKPEFTTMGVAVYVHGGSTWVTVNFAAPMSNAPEKWDNPTLKPNWLKGVK